MGTKVRGHICIRRKAKDGATGPAGAAGKSIRTTVWETGKQYYAGDTQVDGVYPLDIVSDKAMAIGTSGVNFYMCKVSHTSSSNIPLTNTSYWTKLNSLKPVVTYLILAETIKASFIDVDDLVANSALIQTLIANTTFTETLAATTAFINKLIATSAFIDNLSVKHLDAADGIFYGALQFPFANLVSATTHMYDSGYEYHYQLLYTRATSLHLPYTDRYTGSPYSSSPKYIHLHLPNNVPDGIIVNLIGDGYNDKSIMRPFHLHAGSILYETNTESYLGNSILEATELIYNDVFFVRLMSYSGEWYVIQSRGRCELPATT